MASVSKWELGQSYPDIALLPRLATLFDLTIDELLDYRPQLSMAEIREALDDLREAFQTNPFDKALAEARSLAHEYYACPELLAQLASLLLNPSALAPTAELAAEALDATVTLCQRTATLDAPVATLRLARSLEAAVELLRHNPARTKELLGDAADPEVGEFLLVADADMALGDLRHARQTLQTAVYQRLILIVNALTSLATTTGGDPERIRLTHQRTLAVMDAFDLDTLFLNAVAVHLSFAILFARAGADDEAIACCERYLKVAKSLSFPLEMTGDDFFDELDAWFTRSGVSASILPAEQVTRSRIVDGVRCEPAFAHLTADGRFERILRELEVTFR